MVGAPKVITVLSFVSTTLLYVPLVYYCWHDLRCCFLYNCVPLLPWKPWGKGPCPIVKGNVGWLRYNNGKIKPWNLSDPSRNTNNSFYVLFFPPQMGKLFAFATLSLVHLDKALKQELSLPVWVRSSCTNKATSFTHNISITFGRVMSLILVACQIC